MQTMLALLQEQLKVENEAIQKLGGLAQVLKEQSNGAGVREATAAIEPLLHQLTALSDRQTAYLAGGGAGSRPSVARSSCSTAARPLSICRSMS